MSLRHGTRLAQPKSFLLNFDSYSNQSLGPAGGGQVSGLSLFKDSVSNRTFTGTENIYLDGSKTYYTLYALTYPEGSQTPASRDGITPGLNNTTAGKTYSCSRDLNYFAFDEDTNTWVADSYFNGERVSGHCYDTYDGLSGDGVSSEHTKFQVDYDAIKATYPNATHIVIGSHAAENNDNNAGTLSRLQEIGLPNSHIGVDRPEYILVGKPNRPSTWSYVRENISSTVAKMNLGLPIEGASVTGCVFNGTSDNIDTGTWGGYSSAVTCEAWFKTSSSATWKNLLCGPSGDILFSVNGTKLNFGAQGNSPIAHANYSTTDVNNNQWNHGVATYDGSNVRIYVNGVLESTTARSGSFTPGQKRIGSNQAGTSEYFDGHIGVVNMYNTVLTDGEIKQNYRAKRSRYQ